MFFKTLGEEKFSPWLGNFLQHLIQTASEIFFFLALNLSSCDLNMFPILFWRHIKIGLPISVSKTWSCNYIAQYSMVLHNLNC